MCTEPGNNILLICYKADRFICIKVIILIIMIILLMSRVRVARD
jgi:hypothetical protein